MRAKVDVNRQRRLQEYKPLEATREARAMEYHEKVQRMWEANAQHLAKVTGRDPTTLAMFSEDDFVRANQERFLISQVAFALANKDMGTWSPLPRIGDLYAQRETPQRRLKNYELIRNPDQHEQEHVDGQRPTSFFASKYYKKRVKQLRSHIEKLKPHEPSFEGLVVVGEPWPDRRRARQRDFDNEDDIKQTETVEEGVAESFVQVSLDKNRLFFGTTPGATKARTVTVTNEGTTAVYYKWEIAPDVDLMIGSGAGRTPVKKAQAQEVFDWRESEQFDIARNLAPKTRSEFCFTQLEGSILPGCSKSFDFSFKSDVPGCFTQKWILKTTPVAKSDGPLSVVLRGCCEVTRPDLSSFRKSIDDSLHVSERSRCIDEIVMSVLERVTHVIQLRNRKPDDRIDGDVLVDDRGPAFEEVNKKWGLVYSPGLYSSLLKIAERCWDALGITGFDRFWDLSVETISAMAMKIDDGNLKRAILRQINEILLQNMTSSAAGNLTFSLAFIQLGTWLDDAQARFKECAASVGKELPLFLVPKVPDPRELEEAMESSRKRGRGRGGRKPPAKRPTKKGKGQEEEANQPPPEPMYSDELKAAMKQAVKEELRNRLRVFEQLAGESKGVAQQLTRVNEIDRLDTNLDAEVEDDDDL